MDTVRRCWESICLTQHYARPCCSLFLKWIRWNGDNQYTIISLLLFICVFLFFFFLHCLRGNANEIQKNKTKEKKKFTTHRTLFWSHLVAYKNPILLMHIIINYECYFKCFIHWFHFFSLYLLPSTQIWFCFSRLVSAAYNETV